MTDEQHACEQEGRMRKRFAAIWVALFVLTLAAAVLAAKKGTPKSDPRAMTKEQKIDLLAHLNTQARKSGVSAIVSDQTTSAFDQQMSEYILSHKQGLLGCRSLAMQSSTRETEYFEISFVPHAIPNTQPQLFSLDDVRIERSTVALSRQAEDCIVGQYMQLRFEASEAPTSRMTHTMCFTLPLGSTSH